MRAIFLSYRRDDAEGEAGRLFTDLATQFGRSNVFMDVTGIAPGRDFRKVVDKKVGSCGVLLAIIGKGWLDARDEAGRRRLDDPMDFVRLETASALKRDIPVIPVLVRGAVMPRPEQLPEDIRELVYRNAVELTHARWASDVQLLIEAIRPDLSGEGGTGTSGTLVKRPPLDATRPVASGRPADKSWPWKVVAPVIAAGVVAIGFGGYEYWQSQETAAAAAAAREAAAKEAAAREAAERDAAASEAAAREAAAREAAAREAASAAAAAAAREAAAREAATREAAARDAAARESAAREAAARETAAREAAAREAAEKKAAAAEAAEKKAAAANVSDATPAPAKKHKPPRPPATSNAPTGFVSGTQGACGCWGFAVQGQQIPFPLCASGTAQAQMCPMTCPAGGLQWRPICM